jgi:2-keto-4-pentenoate hydratase/2-oxohepta-3-ene-1,7-dioic acid hydratase in catechol pathway
MIHHVSMDETIYPGDVLGSGTVGGGCGLELDRWLKPGDVVELEIQGIGVLRNRVVRPAG